MTVTSMHEPVPRQHASKTKGAVALVTAACIAMGGLLATSSSAAADSSPNMSASVTEVPNERIEVTVNGTGFGDVEALPGQSEPGAYLMVIDKDADLADVTDTATSISTTIDEDGNFTDQLNVPVDELEEGTEYEVISWPNRSFPTETNMFARTDIDIDWDILLDRPADEDDEDGNEDDGASKNFTASATALTGDELEIAIVGSGYGDVQALPGQPGPGAYFTLIEKDADLADVTQGDEALSASIDDEGNIHETWFVDVNSVDPEKDYEVISWPSRSNPSEDNLYGRVDLEIDWEALETPAATPEFTTSVTEIADEQIDIAIDGKGFSCVAALPGQDTPVAYFTLIEKDTDPSAVDRDATAVSADIDENGKLKTVLTIDAADLDASKDYEVISWPARAIPSEDNMFARADVTIDWDALFPGEAPGNDDEEDDDNDNDNGADDSDDTNDITVTVNDSSDASVRQGEDVTFSVAPVTEGTEFNVTVQSDPIELDAVTADESNTASSTWTVPEDFELGEHTVTFVNDELGSFTGTFTVVAADAPADNNADVDNDGAADGDDDGTAVTTAGDQTGGTQSGLATTGASMTAAAIIALFMVVLGVMIVAQNRKRAVAEPDTPSV